MRLSSCVPISGSICFKNPFGKGSKTGGVFRGTHYCETRQVKTSFFEAPVNLDILGYFASVTCPKNTLRCLFYYILSVRLCIFLRNSRNVSILTEHTVQRSLSEP